jgi:hypothetical protein
MPEQNSDVLEILIGQMAEIREVNAVLGKALSYCPSPSSSSHSTIDCIAALDRLCPNSLLFGVGERRSSDLSFMVYLQEWRLTYQRSVKCFRQ